MLDVPEQSSPKCEAAEKLGLDFPPNFHPVVAHGRRAWIMSCWT